MYILCRIISVIRNIVFDHVLLPAGEQTCLENQEVIFMEVSRLLEGPTYLFIQGEKEKNTSVYEMEEAGIL